MSLSRVWLWDPLYCSPPGSSVHEISQARTLEYVAMPFARGSSRPRDRTPGLPHLRQILYCLSHRRQILHHWTTREAVEVLFRRVCLLTMEIRTLYSIILLGIFNPLNWCSFMYFIYWFDVGCFGLSICDLLKFTYWIPNPHLDVRLLVLELIHSWGQSLRDGTKCSYKKTGEKWSLSPACENTA